MILQLLLFIGLCAIGFIALVEMVQFIIDLIYNNYGKNKD